MDQTPILDRRKGGGGGGGGGRFSDVVTTIITYRQKGLQTIIFQSVAIFLSITILFLLTQVYYIFLPCLKALLWALLCGSALYPFKIRLESALKQWLDDLDQKNRSFSFGVLLLPVQVLIACYGWTISFIVENKFVFFVFHFRHQIGEITRIILELLFPIISLHRGIITTLVIVAATVQFVAILLSSSANLIQLVLSFSFLPSFLLLCMLYFSLNFFNLIGEVAFIVFLAISFVGFVATVYRLVYGGTGESGTINEELNAFFAVLGDRARKKLEEWIVGMQRRLNLEDAIDGQEMSIGKLYMRLLFIIFVFAILENVNLSNLVLALFCVHSIVKRIFDTVWLSRLVQWTCHTGDRMATVAVERFKRDRLFGFSVHFFLQGDRIIRTGLQHRLDLITSITLFGLVAMMIAVFSVFLSIKIYGECYSAVYTLQNELKSIEFIQESLNLTLNKVSDPDYLNGLIFSEKFNLRDDEKIFLNKMLVQFRSNILPYFSVMNTTNNNQTNGTTTTTTTTTLKMIPAVLDFSVLDFTDFGHIASLVTSQATSYLPVLKSFLSFSYAFLFVILDSSTFLLSFVLNFIIFALALFYLLALSHDRYKPIEFIDHIVSSLTATPEQDTSQRFSQYVERVINSIFAATLKISAFYGAYTWLLHSLFGFRICFIPSVVAAILAAVPLLNAYWASVPACVYLYYFDLTHRLTLVKSLSMFVLAILPSFIVDSTIYSDIEKGGHPYLTGLAITCGVVYYGVEGALFGPLWLCLLMIILNMCAELDSNIIDSLTP